jgi:tetratricopeptide (TPR) repeat protein
MALRGRKQKRELEEAIQRGRKLQAEDDPGAAAFIEDAATRFPESPEFPLLLSNLFLESRPGEVLALVVKATELGSDDPSTQIRAGHKFLNEGHVEAARACGVRAGELADDEFALMAALESLDGRIAARDGDFVLAEEKLRSAFGRDPEYAVYALHLARFFWARGRNDDALSVIDQSLGQARKTYDLERLRAEIVAEDLSS